jgi:hypothetical protein
MAILFSAALVFAAPAGELAVGDPVPAFSANDQFGKEFKFEAGLRYLLFGFDMDTSKAANLKLADLGAGWLEKHGAAYLLDIHTMPAIARFFAFPKMRKYPQRIILGDDENMLAPYPRQPARITVLVQTPNGKIQEIRYWNPTTEAPGEILNDSTSSPRHAGGASRHRQRPVGERSG